MVPPAGYLAKAREITSAHGALLWIDEVQTGVGRTGDWLVHRAEGVEADIVTLAKGLGNGFPIGACVANGATADLLGPGSHGSTFGGNPVAAIAGLAVLAVIERDGLLGNATAMGDHLVAAVDGLGHPLVSGVRGRGLLRGIVLTEPIAAAVERRRAGRGVRDQRPAARRAAAGAALIVDQRPARSFRRRAAGLLDRAAEGVAS